MFKIPVDISSYLEPALIFGYIGHLKKHDDQFHQASF
jgi:hypothetical protein